MRVQSAPRGRAFVFLRGIEHAPPVGASSPIPDVFCHLSDVRSRVAPGEYVRATVSARGDDGRLFASDVEPVVPSLFHQVQALRAEIEGLRAELAALRE